MYSHFYPYDYLCAVRVLLELNGKRYSVALNEGIDISLSAGPGGDNPNAFHIPEAEFAPIVVGDFVGSVAQGSGANCDTLRICAHGNMTHTECIGHITAEHQSVSNLIKCNFTLADLVTVELKNGAIGMDLLSVIPDQPSDAIVIRTIPNTEEKKSRTWSGSNPPYFLPEVMVRLVELGYSHLFTDLPSVDPEEDDGALAAHHIWWQYPQNPRMHASITELIYVPDDVPDGRYLLNLQFARLETDASPSRPVLFGLTEI